MASDPHTVSYFQNKYYINYKEDLSMRPNDFAKSRYGFDTQEKRDLVYWPGAGGQFVFTKALEAAIEDVPSFYYEFVLNKSDRNEYNTIRSNLRAKEDQEDVIDYFDNFRIKTQQYNNFYWYTDWLKQHNKDPVFQQTTDDFLNRICYQDSRRTVARTLDPTVWFMLKNSVGFELEDEKKLADPFLLRWFYDFCHDVFFRNWSVDYFKYQMAVCHKPYQKYMFISEQDGMRIENFGYLTIEMGPLAWFGTILQNIKHDTKNEIKVWSDKLEETSEEFWDYIVYSEINSEKFCCDTTSKYCTTVRYEDLFLKPNPAEISGLYNYFGMREQFRVRADKWIKDYESYHPDNIRVLEEVLGKDLTRNCLNLVERYSRV